MLEKRYLFGLLLSVFLFGLAFAASAGHFAITDASFTPLNLTVGVGFQDRTISVVFNVTNITGWDDNMTGSGDTYWDNISNITVQAIDSSGQQILLGSNTTGPGNGGILLAEEIATVGGGNYVYVVNVLITYNNSLLNESNVPATGSITLNVTFEILNLTGNGEFNESIDNAGHSILFDVFGPSVSIKFLDINNKEKTTFPATDTVKIVCTSSSSLSNFNDTNVSISVPGGNAFDSLESSTTRASTATDFEVVFTQTRELGDYTAACFTVDDNSLLNDTVNSTFTVVKKIPKGSSPFVDPSFKPPVATILVGSGSVSSLGALTEEGASRLIVKTGAVSFSLSGATYTLTAKDITNTAVIFTVEGSNAFDITVNAQETKNVDVSGDGSDDVAIVLHQVFNKRADTTFKLLTTQQAPPAQQEGQQEETKQSTTTTTVSSGWGMVVFIFLVVFFILGALHYFSVRRRGGNNNSNNAVRFTQRDMGLQRPSGEPRTFTRY